MASGLWQCLLNNFHSWECSTNFVARQLCFVAKKNYKKEEENNSATNRFVLFFCLSNVLPGKTLPFALLVIVDHFAIANLVAFFFGNVCLPTSCFGWQGWGFALQAHLARKNCTHRSADGTSQIVAQVECFGCSRCVF